MGKFYELFHNDAVIAVKELGLVYMKVRASAVTIRVHLTESAWLTCKCDHGLLKEF